VIDDAWMIVTPITDSNRLRRSAEMAGFFWL
jgi:hypothetical protein